MVGLKYVGYREATIQKRKMTVGELRHRIANIYLKVEKKKIVILLLDNGDRLELNSMTDALDFEWTDDCNIEIINIPHIYGSKSESEEMDDDTVTVITIQLAAEELEDSEKTVL